MATGDNVLTAISVARQCGIINSSHEVFLGEVATTDRGGEFVKWTSSLPLPRTQSLGVNSNENFVRPETAESERRDLIASYNPQSSDYIPWHYQNEGISIGITGKAFKILATNKEKNPYVYNSVLAKC